MDTFDEISRETEDIGRKRHSVLQHPPADAMLPARWSCSGGALCWHVLPGDEVTENGGARRVKETLCAPRPCEPRRRR